MEGRKLKPRKADNGKYGYIVGKKNWVIEPKFEFAEAFINGEAYVVYEGLYKILLSDGTFKKMSKMEEYVLSCKKIQNWGYKGWSFLEASNKDGKWKFDSWMRNMSDNEKWYNALKFGIYEDERIARYNDKVDRNTAFAKWANSLNLSTPKDIGELLWANAQQLIDSLQGYDKDDSEYYEKIWTLCLLIVLYNQLENIKSLNLMDLRQELDLPKVNELYLDTEKIKLKATKLCADLVSCENGFEYLDFIKLLNLSHTPTDHSYISKYDFDILEDEDDEDDEWNEDEDWDWDEED